MLLGMWDLAGPGIEPVSLALQGRFLTTGPPGKPSVFCVCLCLRVTFLIHLSQIPLYLSCLLYSVRFLFFHLFYNWRIIALLCGVGFCCTTTQISNNYIYIYPLPHKPPSPLPFHTSGSSRNARLGSLCQSAFLSLTHGPKGLPQALQCHMLPRRGALGWLSPSPRGRQHVTGLWLVWCLPRTSPLWGQTGTMGSRREQEGQWKEFVPTQAVRDPCSGTGHILSLFFS